MKSKLLGLLAILAMACQPQENKEAPQKAFKIRTNNDNISVKRVAVDFGPDKLSDFGFFVGDMATLSPASNVYPYELNTPLFSDYAGKARFIAFPENGKATYNHTEVFSFPIGTVLIKNFYFPSNEKSARNGKKIIETRLLKLEEIGWNALTYIWNDEQTEAYLEYTGGTVDVTFEGENGVIKNVAYGIPSLNQCKNCHANKNKLMPIGPTARQLNRDNSFNGASYNQLAYLSENSRLEGLPSMAEVPRLAVWNDAGSGTLEARARAYLDINCGSCHRPEGTANTSGLFLHYHQEVGTRYGIKKTPVAAGKGSGGLTYDILPGAPDQSILIYRMRSTDPGIMMPEIGRKLVHDEGVALVAEWIKSM